VVNSETTYRSLVEAAPDAMVVADESGVILIANAETERLTGYARSELLGRPVELLVPVELRARHAVERSRFTAGTDNRPMGSGLRLHARRKDGSLVPIEVSLSHVETGVGRFVCAALRDITARAAAEEALREGEERFRLILQTSPIGLAEVGLDGRWLTVSPALCRLLERSAEQLASMTYLDVTHPDDVAGDEALVTELREGRLDSYQLDKRYVAASGRAVWVSLNVALVRAPDGSPLRYLVQVEDISHRRRHSEELRRLAETDALTGLANRAALMARARRDATGGALVLMDLDHFKLVNDLKGHRAGDAVLVEVGRRLLAAARDGDVVARFGGDEFAVLLTGVHEEEEAAAAAERLRLRVATGTVRVPLPSGGFEEMRLSASVGLALAADSDGIDDMYRQADVALYEAKGRGRGRVATYDARMAARLEAAQREEARLRTALAERRLVAFHQPLVDLRSGAVVGYEALARIAHPDGTVDLPGRFLPVARTASLLVDVDTAVLRATLEHLRQHPAAVVNVNASAETLQAASWSDEVLAFLEEHPCVAGRLSVEVTEEAVMDARGVVATVLADLRERGVQVGIDDFGTGYSALSYLQDLSLDFIKLDRSLVEGVGRFDRADTLAAALVDLAHALDLQVVAEGVTRPVQVDRLRELGCDRAQGYLLGIPTAPHAGRVPPPRLTHDPVVATART
jgi:diguanylate cyclase (GGDEF)-like protein/PAS domain S-box-containing protein